VAEFTQRHQTFLATTLVPLADSCRCSVQLDTCLGNPAPSPIDRPTVEPPRCPVLIPGSGGSPTS